MITNKRPFNRKAIWVSEKLHKNIKRIAYEEDSTIIAIIETAFKEYYSKCDDNLDTNIKRL